MIVKYSEEAGLSTSTMLKIARCESGFNPKAKNPTSTATGVYQVIIGTWKHFKCEGERTNAEDNIKCGMKIAKTSGLHHWECWNKNL